MPPSIRNLSAISALTPFLLVGCAALRADKPSKPDVAAPTADSILDLNNLANPGAAPVQPGRYHKYYVGMTSSGDTAQGGGDFFVRERSEAWSNNGVSLTPAVLSGPETAWREGGAYHPDPTTTEYEEAIAKAGKTIESLSRENAKLVSLITQQQPQPAAAELTNAPTTPGTQNPASSAQGSSATDTAAADTSDDKAQVLVPNADHCIELDPRYFDNSLSRTTNPFVQLFQPKLSVRTFNLSISAAFPGPTASCIINNSIFSLGDKIEGLTVATITQDTIIFKKDNFLLKCPVGNPPISFKIPY
jgi:hypothetical protein